MDNAGILNFNKNMDRINLELHPNNVLPRFSYNPDTKRMNALIFDINKPEINYRAIYEPYRRYLDNQKLITVRKKDDDLGGSVFRVHPGYFSYDEISRFKPYLINNTSFGLEVDNPEDNYAPLEQKILEQVGFEFSSSTATTETWIPSPSRLKRAGQVLGLPFHFTANVSKYGHFIDSASYDNIFSKGRIPIGLAIAGYMHDTGFDHMPAWVVGGGLFGNMLFESINKKTYYSEIDRATAFDSVSAYFTVAIKSKINDNYIRYEKGLHNTAKVLLANNALCVPSSNIYNQTKSELHNIIEVGLSKIAK